MWKIYLTSIIFVSSVFHCIDEDNYRVFDRLSYFRVPHFCGSGYSDIVARFDRCSYPLLLRLRLRFVSASGDSTLPFVSSLINSATGRLPCFSRLGIKSRILLLLGKAIVRRANSCAFTQRETKRAGENERIGEHMNGDSCERSSGQSKVAEPPVNVEPFTFP